jgi:SAM-dependent methyltransferase
VAIVRAGYDRIADGFLAAVQSRTAPDPRDEWVPKLLARLSERARILDAGCGAGVPTARDLVERGHEVVGIDVSPRQVELARAHVPDATFIVDDVSRAELGTATFDGIVALYSLTHVPRSEYPELFAHFASALRPGGCFLGAVGRSDSDGFDERDFLGFDGTDSWTNSYDAETMLAIVGGAGLTIAEHSLIDEATPFGPERWLWILAVANGPST